MSKISFFMLPEPGHFMPTLRLAVALRKLGHVVCYFTIAQFQEFFTSLAFECHVLPLHCPLQTESNNVFTMPNTAEVIRDTLDAHLKSTGGRRGDELLSELRKHETGLLLCDTALICDIEAFAGELGCKVALLNTSLPDLCDQGANVSLPEFVLCPWELEIPGSEWAIRHRRFGEPSVYRDRLAMDFKWETVDHRKALTYCSFGTQWPRYHGIKSVLKSVIEAFAGMPTCQLIVVANGVTPSDLVDPLPGNVRVVQAAPQLELLGCAELLITHGGLGSVKEAILARVPMLVIPFLFDQPGNAKRVEHHGLGRELPPARCSPDEIRSTCQELVRDAAIRTSLDGMSEIFATREAEAPIAKALAEMTDSLDIGCGV